MSQWAVENRFLSRDYTPRAMRYSLDVVPYAAEPMDCATDEGIRTVCLMWASQTTKTTTLENVLGYFIVQDPSPILLVQPTVEMAQAWSKERFAPMIKDMTVLRDHISDAKSRDSNNTIQLKTFPGGNLAIVGANAPSGLASRPRRVVLLDEVDRFPASAGTEGDPVALAVRRTEAFHNAVVFLTSTPTIKGASRIESEFDLTDKRKWFVPCGQCGTYQVLEWKQVKWPEGKPEQAYYECERCKASWDDAGRVAAVRAGEWRPTAVFSGKRGYFLNGIYSPFKAKRGFASRLHQMATDFLEAKHGGPEQLKTWTNTFLAETWEDETERIDVSGVLARAENYTGDSLPAGCVLLVAGMDVQKDRIEIEVSGCGLEDETWGVEVLKVFGDTEKPDTWQRLSTALDRVYRREDGIELRITAAAVDIHYRPQAARRWVAAHGTRLLVFPVLGIGQAQGALVVERLNKQYNQRTFSISTDAAKDIVYSRLKIDVPGPRYCHFPRGCGYTEEWYKQLTAERVHIKHTRGFAKRIWEKDSGARNEALDMRVYALGCVEILRPNVAAIAKQIEASKTKPTEPQQHRPQRGGWVNGWK